jgi:hypothetical protein
LIGKLIKILSCFLEFVRFLIVTLYPAEEIRSSNILHCNVIAIRILQVRVRRDLVFGEIGCIVPYILVVNIFAGNKESGRWQ